MFKLHFLGICLLSAYMFTACSSSKTKKAQNTQRKPNVLFILADDYGYSDNGVYGSKYYETKNIDKIASNGMVFTNGYATCSVCSPSRASIMTGCFTPRHGVTDWIGEKSGKDWRKLGRHNKMLPADYVWHLNKNMLTIPEAMRKDGYFTFFAGKWHLEKDNESTPEDNGFNINIGGWSAGSPRGGYFSPWINPKLPNTTKGENLSMRLAKETSKFIKSRKGNKVPFFAYLSFYAVHGGIQTSEIKWKKYRDKAEKLGMAKTGFAKGDLIPYRLHQDNPVYAGLVESMDDAVGKVLNTLKETGLDKNTIVIFTSDNGGVNSGDSYSTNNFPFKGGKGTQWEGGIREPYIINVPWMNLKGVKNATPVTGADFFPTILDLCNLKLHPEAHKDGVSLLPVLKGQTIKERPLFWHYPHYGNQGGRPCSIERKGKWKLIYYWEDNHSELYDLSADIHEDHNLASQEPGITKTMDTELLSWLKSVHARYPKPDPQYNAKEAAKYNKKKMDRLMKNLEKQHTAMFKKDWKPNSDWWGSFVVND